MSIDLVHDERGCRLIIWGCLLAGSASSSRPRPAMLRPLTPAPRLGLADHAISPAARRGRCAGSGLGQCGRRRRLGLPARRRRSAASDLARRAAPAGRRRRLALGPSDLIWGPAPPGPADQDSWTRSSLPGDHQGDAGGRRGTARRKRLLGTRWRTQSPRTDADGRCCACISGGRAGGRSRRSRCRGNGGRAGRRWCRRRRQARRISSASCVEPVSSSLIYADGAALRRSASRSMAIGRQAARRTIDQRHGARQAATAAAAAGGIHSM